MYEDTAGTQSNEEVRAEAAQEGETFPIPEPPTEPEPVPAPTTSVRPHRPRGRRPSIFWPMILVGVGVMLLLANLGILPWQSWGALWRFWPLLLVLLGLDVLIGRRSTAGAIFSTLLILILIGGIVAIGWFAEDIPFLNELLQPAELRTERVKFPLEGLDSASIYIDWSSMPCEVAALGESVNLIEGTVTHRGEVTFDARVHGSQARVRFDTGDAGFEWWREVVGGEVQPRCHVGLSPEIAMQLELDCGSGPGELDLSGLHVDELALDCGSGPVDLELPSVSSPNVTIDGGSGPLDINLPEGVGARVVLDSGSGPFLVDERFRLVEGEYRGDGIWETEGYDSAEHSILLEIDQGSGPISIR